MLDQRHRLMARERESLRHLQNQLKCSCETLAAKAPALRDLEKSLSDCETVGKEYTNLVGRLENLSRSKHDATTVQTNLATLRKFQSDLATVAIQVLVEVLFPAWEEEKHSFLREAKRPDTRKNEKSEDGQGDSMPSFPETTAPEYVSAAEEVFVLPCLGFIQNILGRIRTLTMGMLFLFVAATLSTACYPFDSRPVLGGMFLGRFRRDGGHRRLRLCADASRCNAQQHHQY